MFYCSKKSPVDVTRMSSVQATGLSADNMRVVLERCYNDLRLLYVPNKTLKAEGFFRSNKVPMCSSCSELLPHIIAL